MRRTSVVMFLLVNLFLPTLTSEADQSVFSKPINHRQTGLFKQAPDQDIPYAFSHLTVKKGPVAAYKISHARRQVRETPFSLVSTAEAADSILTNDYVEQLYNSVNQATSLEDLRPVLSEHNYQVLKDKEKAGVSQYTILAVIQSMRPNRIQVLDSDVAENRAVVAVTGWSHYGPMQGIVHLAKTPDGLWRIENEEWRAANANVPVYSFLSPVKNARPNNDLMAQITPDCQRDGNFLGLMKVPHRRENRAIQFVFLMNKPKVDPTAVKVLPGEEYDPVKDKRNRMHILWTGSKKYPKDQQLVHGEYPIDVSLARYNEGFAPGEWNLVLPRKKPREIDLTMLWAF